MSSQLSLQRNRVTISRFELKLEVLLQFWFRFPVVVHCLKNSDPF